MVMLVLVLVFGRAGGAYVQSPPGEALLAQHRVDYRLGEQIRLIGYDLSGTELHAGENLRLTLYWYADAPTQHQYDSFVHVGVPGLPPLAQPPGKDNPGGRPTTTWSVAGYLRDEYVIMLPAEMPAGTYSVMVGLYTYETCAPETCPNGDRLPVFAADGEALGDVVVLATITVTAR